MSRSRRLQIWLGVLVVGSIGVALWKYRTTIYSTYFETTLVRRTQNFVTAKEATGSLNPDDQAKMKAIEHFINNSFVRDEFLNIKDIVAMQIEKINRMDLSKEKKNDLLQKVTASFDIYGLFNTYLEILNRQLNLDELKQLEKIYEDKNIAKTMKAIQRTRTKEGQQELAKYVQKIADKAMTIERQVLLKKLDEATGMSRSAAALASEVMVLTQESIYGDKLSSLKAEDRANLIANRDKLQGMMEKKVAESVTLTLAKACSEFSDQDIKNMLALRSQPAAIKESKIRSSIIGIYVTEQKSKKAAQIPPQSAPTTPQ